MKECTMIPVPNFWPDHFNASYQKCDMIEGPCSCGAWHNKDEEWIKENIEKYGLANFSVETD